MLTRIDHIGIACFDLDTTVEFYRATYGFEVFHSEVNEEQGVREAMLKINNTDDGGASYLQLLEPTREDSAVGKWLAKNGEGVHHIAFGTADVDGTPRTSARRAYAFCTRSPGAVPWGHGSRSCTQRIAMAY
jgi:methylmalonyl-CoA/ethylmalonyl-CoA epimerase